MKKDKTIVIGHKNPDTDSILSAILVSFYARKIFGRDIEARRAGEINKETAFILNRLLKSAKIRLPKILNKISRENVVLVDTTEPSQIIEGLRDDKLFAIIDHHQLGGLKSLMPIYARVEPLGCTCSIIYKILKEKNIKINKVTATMMIAAIVSDTLFFNSPTTTLEDKKIVKELNKYAKLNIKELAENMFNAKSILTGIKPADIIKKDYKFFMMGKNRVGIGVWETVNPLSVEGKKQDIIAALKNKKNKDKLDYLFFGVVDIIKQNTYLYVFSDDEKALAKDIFKGTAKDEIMVLKGIVSRKKQIVPLLMDKLGQF